MFLKRKQSGKMKGRGCTDGRPQQEYITKEESSSPTVSLYALMDFCVMDALDNRKNNNCEEIPIRKILFFIFTILEI